MEKKDKKRSFREQLKNRYRLVVLNDDTFEEKFALRLTPLGLLILFGSVTIIMTFLVISLVAFTPLREYIPGYGNVDQKRELIILTARADSLEESMEAKDWFIKNIGDVLAGKTEGKPENQTKIQVLIILVLMLVHQQMIHCLETKLNLQINIH
ncbi:MAG: hypothetical protein IPG89_00985 [Bacteroidetes bacterium]|nr:hypothetical protein [Bacteroidota bacterium]